MNSQDQQKVALIHDRLIDERELSVILRRSLPSIRRDRLLRRGVPFVKLSSSVRYRLRDVHAYIQSLQTFGHHGGQAWG
jgi:hypothetical protein